MNKKTLCLGENKILRAMRDAVRCANGRTPAESPGLLVELDNHRRNCLTCQGLAAPLENELFGRCVQIGASNEQAT